MEKALLIDGQILIKEKACRRFPEGALRILRSEACCLLPKENGNWNPVSKHFSAGAIRKSCNLETILVDYPDMR